MKNKSSLNYTTLLGGFVIIVGLVLYAVSNHWFGLDKQSGWPIYILLPGIALLLLSLKDTGSKVRLIALWIGSFLSLLSLFFFMFSTELFQWREMDRLWPVFVLLPGISGLIAFFLGEEKSPWLLRSSALLTILGLIFWVLLAFLSLHSAWPLLIILAGIGLIGMSFWRRH